MYKEHMMYLKYQNKLWPIYWNNRRWFWHGRELDGTMCPHHGDEWRERSTQGTFTPTWPCVLCTCLAGMASCCKKFIDLKRWRTATPKPIWFWCITFTFTEVIIRALMLKKMPLHSPLTIIEIGPQYCAIH